MPSRSPAQKRLMRAVAHGWKKPGGGGPTRAVAKEFVNADRRGKVQSYQFGGITGPGMYGGALNKFARQQMPQGPAGMRDPRQSGPKIRPGPSNPRVPPRRGGLSQVHQQMMRQGRGMQNKFQGRRIAPPPGKYPGGGGPNLGRRNPMMRQAMNQSRPFMGGRGRGGRGATSYLR